MCKFVTCESCCVGGCFWVQGEGWAKCFATKEEISGTAYFYLFPGQEKHCPPDDTPPSSNLIEYSSSQIIGILLIVGAIIFLSAFVGYLWGSDVWRMRMDAFRLVCAERFLEFIGRFHCFHCPRTSESPIELTSVVFSARHQPSSSIEVVEGDEDEISTRLSRISLTSNATIPQLPIPLPPQRLTVSALVHNTPRNVVDHHPLINLSPSSTPNSLADTLPPPSPPSPSTPPTGRQEDVFFSPRGQDFETTTTTTTATPAASTSGGITVRIKKRKVTAPLNESATTRPQRKATQNVSYVNQ